MNEELDKGYLIVMITLILILLSLLTWIGFQVYESWYGRKCPHCKQRSLKWLQWHQMNKHEFRGYIWCPKCQVEYRIGFETRVFG